MRGLPSASKVGGSALRLRATASKSSILLHFSHSPLDVCCVRSAHRPPSCPPCSDLFLVVLLLVELVANWNLDSGGCCGGARFCDGSGCRLTMIRLGLASVGVPDWLGCDARVPAPESTSARGGVLVVPPLGSPAPSNRCASWSGYALASCNRSGVNSRAPWGFQPEQNHGPYHHQIRLGLPVAHCWHDSGPGTPGRAARP